MGKNNFKKTKQEDKAGFIKNQLQFIENTMR